MNGYPIEGHLKLANVKTFGIHIMRLCISTIVLSLILLVGWLATNTTHLLSEEEKETINLKDLSDISHQFKIKPYLSASVALQKMGKEKACEQLKKLAEQGDLGQVALLCRLLFSKKSVILFRSPHFGKPVYLGGTSDDDWDLSPIEFVDEVPFFIVLHYNLGGEAEHSIFYLEYCLENCEWWCHRPRVRSPSLATLGFDTYRRWRTRVDQPRYKSLKFLNSWNAIWQAATRDFRTGNSGTSLHPEAGSELQNS